MELFIWIIFLKKFEIYLLSLFLINYIEIKENDFNSLLNI